MPRSLLPLVALAAFGASLLPALAFAGNCSNGSKYVNALSVGGATFEIKATCKSSWQVFVDASSSPQYLRVSADEDGTSRYCEGYIYTAGSGFGDISKQKIECPYEDKDHRVKIEVKRQ